jgi:hypothetical protein
MQSCLERRSGIGDRIWIYRRGAKVAKGREGFGWGNRNAEDAEAAERDAERDAEVRDLGIWDLMRRSWRKKAGGIDE